MTPTGVMTPTGAAAKQLTKIIGLRRYNLFFRSIRMYLVTIPCASVFAHLYTDFPIIMKTSAKKCLKCAK